MKDYAIVTGICAFIKFFVAGMSLSMLYFFPDQGWLVALGLGFGINMLLYSLKDIVAWGVATFELKKLENKW